MRYLLLVCFSAFLFSCNSSDKEKKTESVTVDSSGAQKMEENQINPLLLPVSQIPSALKFRGKPQEVWQWTDKNGDNILITSVMEPYSDAKVDENEMSGELHAFHYVKKDTAYKLLWKISDGVKNCGLDMVNEFVKGSATVTDLDKNGVAETIVVYAMACRGDVSPSSMKLIMHEDTVKYSLRGMRWMHAAVASDGADVKFDVTEETVNFEKQPKPKEEWELYIRSFGRYESEKDFSTAPPEFLNYARKQWLKFAIESLN